MTGRTSSLTTSNTGASTTSFTTSGTGGGEYVEGCYFVELYGCDGTELLACDGHYHTVAVGDCADHGMMCLDQENPYYRLLGCFECDPTAHEPTCDGQVATRCGWHGSVVTETCSGECQLGQCCHPDADGDGLRDCDGDCDDLDPDAHPGQVEFYGHETASGHFDWNCDGVEEKRYTSTGYCTSCCWLGDTVPDCGEHAGFRECCEYSLCPDDSDHTQPCR